VARAWPTPRRQLGRHRGRLWTTHGNEIVDGFERSTQTRRVRREVSGRPLPGELTGPFGNIGPGGDTRRRTIRGTRSRGRTGGNGPARLRLAARPARAFTRIGRRSGRFSGKPVSSRRCLPWTRPPVAGPGRARSLDRLTRENVPVLDDGRRCPPFDREVMVKVFF